MNASKFVTMPLPHGRDWLYYSDINLLALAPHLDAAGRERCVEECAAEWRTTMRERLASVPTTPDPAPPDHLTPRPVLVPVVTFRPTSVSAV